MKNSENAARPASEIAMLSGRHCRLSGKDAHARRNPPNNSSSTRILQVHHAPRQNGVTRLVPTVRTAAHRWPNVSFSEKRDKISAAPPLRGVPEELIQENECQS